MQPASTLRWIVLASLVLSGCHATSPAPQRAPPEGRARATVIPDANWSNWQTENDSRHECAGDRVLIGREREKEADERDRTRYLCATIRQLDADATIGERWMSGDLPENDHRFSCATRNGVMRGRAHYWDEESPTDYYCGSLVDRFGQPMIVIEDPNAHQIDSESDHGQFICPAGHVMTYRSHFGDENKPSWYKCAEMY